MIGKPVLMLGKSPALICACLVVLILVKISMLFAPNFIYWPEAGKHYKLFDFMHLQVLFIFFKAVHYLY